MIDDQINKFIREDYKNFKVALTHSSYLNENTENIRTQSNERLEYLGDSVISFIVSKYLYNQYPNLLEGELSKIRSEIVNQKSLSNFSLKLNLGEHLILGKGEELNNGRNKISNLCNLFEAIIGYMAINIGLEKTEANLIDLFKDKIEQIYISKSYFDSKSLLQEKLQEDGKDLPKYDSNNLPDGQFKVDLYVNNILISTGYAKRKIEAEKSAAQKALDNYSEKLKND